MHDPSDPSPFARARRLALRPPVLVALIAAVALAAAVAISTLSGSASEELALSEFDSLLADGTVVSLELDERSRIATAELTDGTVVTSAYPEGFGSGLVRQAMREDVAVGIQSNGPPSAGGAALRLAPVLVVVLLILLVVRHAMGGSLRNSRNKQVAVPETRFADVAGVDEVTAELAEVVAYLREPEEFAALGARAPKGVLLIGSPGTGKTMLARAVAGEAGVPFYALSGSDFVEKFVGVGAARVRGVFDRARKAGRAIIFIDELDAVGKRRGGSSTSNDERENTLNQLLVEMDGFASSEIVVLAATNRPDTLDTALTRPGRFDRQITVGPPDRAGRRAILALHLGDRAAPDVDLDAVAGRTPGFTGADLANLANQSALAATRDRAGAITSAHVADALATVSLGRERRSIEVLVRDREITAWHEAGHAVAAMVQPDAQDPAGVSIIPRGHAGGVTWMSGDDHQFLLTPQAHAQLAVAMAGRAAEELVFGAAYSHGASGDLRSATELATRMAAEFGMSPVVGPMHIPEDQRQVGRSADLLHRAVKELLVEALEQARAILDRERLLLSAVTEALLTHETLDADDLVRLREEHAPMVEELSR